MKIKSIYVNHKSETFAVLTACQALDVLFSLSGEQGIDLCRGSSDGIFYLSEDEIIEYFRDNTWTPFEQYHVRLKDLQSCYTDTTGHFEMIYE